MRDTGANRAPVVGLNAQLLSLGASYRGAGVSHYIHNLLLHLPQVATGLRFLAYLGHCGRDVPGGLRYEEWQTRVSRLPTGNPVLRILWEQMVQPWSARRERLSLLHAPVYVAPVAAPCPVVVTIHDLSFYLYPDLFRPGNRRYLQAMTRRTVHDAAGVIAVSENTRRDLVRILGVEPERVTVVPNGVGQEMRPTEDPLLLAAWRRQRGLPEKMILFLGTLEPRKNITILLEAFARLDQPVWAGYRLVVAGGKGWYYDAIERAIQRLGLRERVILPGFVPQQELPLWYNAAQVFAYPSLYEGFGLPPLEAMACGTPVIVSAGSALAETVGDAGLAVDPHDAGALAAALEQVLADETLRQTLRQRGLTRAAGYTWQATAGQTAQLYRRVLGME